MRTKMLCVLMLLSAATAVAADSLALHQELLDVKAYMADRSVARFLPDVVTKAKGDYWFVIPAAGSLAGANGTNFKSDVMLSNHRNVAQLVDISFYAQNANGADGFALKRISIPANSAVFYPDFIRTQLGKSGLGTLDFRARTSTGGLDTDAMLDGFSRIWTPQANSAGTPFAGGTTSQAFPPVTIDNLSGTLPVTILGLQHDGTFRTNVGIFNKDITRAHTFSVQLAGTGGSTTFTISVPAWSMNQVSVPAGNWGNFALTITPDSTMSGEWWAAYASSTDNITGDGWVSIGSQNTQ